MEFTYQPSVTYILNIKGQPTHKRSHVALIAQLGEHCTGSTKVISLNPVQSLEFFSDLFFQ